MLSSFRPAAHVVAYFEDERTAELIKHQCPNVEAVNSLSVELLVRASCDPGASQVANRLLSAESKDTAFSMALPDSIDQMSYLDLLIGLKRHNDITVVGIAEAASKIVDLNCPSDRLITAGDIIFYVADARLSPDEIRWRELKEQPLPIDRMEQSPLLAESESKSETADKADTT